MTILDADHSAFQRPKDDIAEPWRLLERAPRAALDVPAVVPETVLAAKSPATLDLLYEHAKPGSHDQEVDLALHLMPVAGDVLRMEDCPLGVGLVGGEMFEDELLALTRRLGIDRGRDQVHAVSGESGQKRS